MAIYISRMIDAAAMQEQATRYVEKYVQYLRTVHKQAGDFMDCFETLATAFVSLYSTYCTLALEYTCTYHKYLSDTISIHVQRVWIGPRYATSDCNDCNLTQTI